LKEAYSQEERAELKKDQCRQLFIQKLMIGIKEKRRTWQITETSKKSCASGTDDDDDEWKEMCFRSSVRCDACRTCILRTSTYL